MGKPLSTIALMQLNSHDIRPVRILTVNGIDYSSYLMPNYTIDSSKEFGSMSATFFLDNSSGELENAFEVGDTVSFKEKFESDDVEFEKFYGKITQKPTSENYQSKTLSLVCLDILSDLQGFDVDMEIEGDKILVENEILSPVYLPSPNDSLASLYNFANNSIADNPRPNIIIKDRIHSDTDPAYDGYEINYALGQMRLGFPLNAKYNYDVIAVSYYYYVQGVYAEDIIESLLTTPDSYGNYLFGESSAQAVIDNHLTESFLNVEGTDIDYLVGNATSSTIAIRTSLTADYIPEDGGTGTICVEDTSGFPSSGQAEINGDIFTWTSKDQTHLYGIPVEGSTALNAHSTGSLVKYETDYEPGRVWYLKYSRLITNLTSTDFTVPGGTVDYIDRRFGRVLLSSAISLSSVVTCNVNYSFCTLQATGTEINRIAFRSRELENRYEALKKVLEYLEPNYLVHTKGDNKIWASYLYQREVADYSLDLVTSVNTIGDDDLYTRVVLYKKNKNPTNLMFNGNVSFVTTGQSYKSIASQLELVPIAEEPNFFVYGSLFNSSVMIDTGAKTVTSYPATCVDDDSHGTSYWMNPSEAAYDDGLYSQCNLSWEGTSHYLRLTNFGFKIPSDATVQGITVSVKKVKTGGDQDTYDDVVRLVVGGVLAGDNKASSSPWNREGAIYSSYGSTNDLWGLSLTPDQINSTSFGLVIAIKTNGWSAGKIDSVNLTVTYEEANADTTVPKGKINSGRIIVETIKPTVYVNNTPIDNSSHKILAQQVVIETKTTTTTTQSGGK